MEEVKSIGSLPCLEHVALLNNPLSIIPDYRTKVLAQFGERASEVSCWGGAGDSCVREMVPMESGFSQAALEGTFTVLCLPASEGHLALKGLLVLGILLPPQEEAFFFLLLLWGYQLPWFPLASPIPSLAASGQEGSP